jgi:hypothetical protein
LEWRFAVKRSRSSLQFEARIDETTSMPPDTDLPMAVPPPWTSFEPAKIVAPLARPELMRSPSRGAIGSFPLLFLANQPL